MKSHRWKVSVSLLSAALTLVATHSTFALGGTDINLITSAEAGPHITQNESSVWSHSNTIVVAYNDSSGVLLSPLSNCGVSTSTDGGQTFTRLAAKFNDNGDCFGNPSVFYSASAAKWYVSFL